jgi:unsaturated chondroitin disaccharide hydrolase
MKTISCLFLVWISAVSAFGADNPLPPGVPRDLTERVNHSLEYAFTQVKKTLAALPDTALMPVSTKPDGSWMTAGIYDWRSGFFPGCLWMAYAYRPDDLLKAAAAGWTVKLEPIKDYSGNHDVGFMIFCSFGNGYRLTGDEKYREVILRAARSLAKRYNPRVGLIQSWNADRRWQYPVIIDNMMNLELLFWAARHGGDSDLSAIAETHALNTLKNHVRADGSTWHVVDYDPATGNIRGKHTHQGYADSTAWSRGQAWGVYGFTMVYRETKNPLFLKAAQILADYYISHLPEDFIPFWDFQAPGIPNEPRDSSAAAIASSGLLELSVLAGDEKDRNRYRQAALNMLSSLCTPKYMTEGSPGAAILRHATGSKPHGSDVDASLIYGDYYFLEALLRYKGILKLGKIK